MSAPEQEIVEHLAWQANEVASFLMEAVAKIEAGASLADYPTAEARAAWAGMVRLLGEARLSRLSAEPSADSERNALVVERLQALRNNMIATQSATWSNVSYPIVAILNAAGLSYEEPPEHAQREHLNCYGGAGGMPGSVKARGQR